ncbi:hypothetical protein [Methyloversatilis universalis]|uniref:hypothetical protein n=1 Tax=Methyloversatilis universalis TaxID=378211 RepID=UPI0012FCB74E|nr:hypothetical protein [Methyloversatilis universalis]
MIGRLSFNVRTARTVGHTALAAAYSLFLPEQDPTLFSRRRATPETRSGQGI